MIFGLHCYRPACRPHPASLPVRVPTVEGLLPASFGFTSRLRLAVRYGYHHQFRRAPFIPIDSAHAGHTHVGGLADKSRRHDFRRGEQDCSLHGFGLGFTTWWGFERRNVEARPSPPDRTGTLGRGRERSQIKPFPRSCRAPHKTFLAVRGSYSICREGSLRCDRIGRRPCGGASR